MNLVSTVAMLRRCEQQLGTLLAHCREHPLGHIGQERQPQLHQVVIDALVTLNVPLSEIGPLRGAIAQAYARTANPVERSASVRSTIGVLEAISAARCALEGSAQVQADVAGAILAKSESGARHGPVGKALQGPK